MNEPIVETPINAHYKEFLSHESEELKERLGVDYPQEMTYLDFEELLDEWHTMVISVTFDIDIPEDNNE